MYSIIIPVYDSEKYLCRCIDSVLNQTRSDFELILIDDGSKDQSADICKEYAKKDDRVKYIRQENAGVSAARNKGISIASGDYIGFVDSDDEICPDMYETLLNSAEKSGADIVLCDTVTVYSNGTTEEDTLPNLPPDKIIKTEEIYPEQLLYTAGSACRCIYKKTLFEDKNIRFPVGIKLSEDRIFNILAIGQADSIYYKKTAFYLRHVIISSAVNKHHSDYFSTVIRASEKTEEALDYCGFDAKFVEMYGRQTVNGAMSAVYNEFHKDSPKKFLQKISAVREICKNERVQRALDIHGNDFKCRLMKKKKVYLLALLAKVRSIMK